MIYIIPAYYEPQTAATNRLLALLSGLSDIITETIKVCFFLPDSHKNKVIGHDYPNIDFIYYWENYFFKKRYFIILSWYLNIVKFYKSLAPNDIVLVLGQNEVLPFISKRKDIKVFHERNEYPELWPVGTGFCKISLKKYWKICREIAGMFVISTPLKHYFIEHGVKEEKIHIYNMIVDGNRFEKLTKHSCEKFIAYCGTIGDYKDGVNRLLQSFSYVSQKHPEVLLYIIGKEPSNMAQYEEYLRQEGLKEKVIFTGLVNYNQMPQLLKNATMLVLDRPNNIQAKYGFPTKLGEYLMTGNPVVVTSVGDIPLFLENGVSALLAKPDNENEFAEKMNWILDHPQEAARIGENGKAVARLNFNPQIEAEKIIKVIKQ